MQARALRPRLFVLAAAGLAPIFVASIAGAETWPTSSDKLLSEIQGHFHATRKWFGMVSDLRLERAADGTVSPRFETLHSKFVLLHDPAGQTLNAHLPAQASAAHVVEFDGVNGFSVRTEEIGMQPVPAEIHQGVIVYRGAVAGGDLLYKLTPTHLDEYIYLREPPAHLHREFEFDTGSAVWSLREADTNIEAVGKDGVAHLRLSAPLARAADGKRRRGTAHVVGRKIILDIDLTGLAAPILVDPDWSTTGTMTTSHWGDAAWRRPDGRVMVAGGCALTGCPSSFVQTSCGQVLANTDVWNPSSGTWTSSAAMGTARTTFAGVPLASGDLIAAGGCTETNCTQMNDAGFCVAQICTTSTNLAERYSFDAGAWVDAGALSSPRFASMGAPVGTGDALVAGGCDVSACTTDVERWSAATSIWSEQTPLPAPRGYGTATMLADGRILIIGGCTDPLCATVLNDATVYDPVANTWTAAGVMSSPRAGQSATLLNDGTVLVAGGCMDSACMNVLSSVDLWSASAQGNDGGTSEGGEGGEEDAGAGGQFVAAPPMAAARHHHTANHLANGEVLMAGGANASGASIPTSEVYLPLAHEWVGTGAMLMARAFHIGVDLTDGKVLVSGGCNPATCIPFAEIFSAANLPADSEAGVDASLLEQLLDSGTAAAVADAGPAPLPTSPHPAVYRTGVVTCSTDTAQDLTCPQAGWELQDGDFQPNLQSMTETAADEVIDNHTGLIWQLEDTSNTYTYSQAMQYCASFKSCLNSTKNTCVEEVTGWRLPSVIELMTLIDNGVDLPSINPYFNAAQSTNYWTSTPTATTNNLAWTVKFDFGEVIPLLMDTSLPVRCVRGKSTILNVGGDGGSVGLRKAGPLQSTPLTVQDTTTGLEWQREDDGVRRDQKGGMDYCASLPLGGLSGWHLPNISELLSLVQYDAVKSNGVAIDPAFMNPKADLYWSSSQNEGAPTLSWSVTFNLGVVDGISVTGLGFARCVRHLQTPTAVSTGSSCGCKVAGGASDRGTSALSTSALAALAALAIFRRRPLARERKALQ